MASKTPKKVLDTGGPTAHSHSIMKPKEVIRIRRSMGLNQLEFARLLKVSTPTVSRWESGTQAITDHHADHIRLRAEKELRLFVRGGVDAARSLRERLAL